MLGASPLHLPLTFRPAQGDNALGALPPLIHSTEG
jgi:hypothetical protein